MPGLAPRLDEIVLTLLEKRPVNRYESAQRLLEELEKVDQAGGQEPQPRPAGSQQEEPTRYIPRNSSNK